MARRERTRTLVASAALVLLILCCEAAQSPGIVSERRPVPESVLNAGKALQDRSAPYRERAAAVAALHDIVKEDPACAEAHRMLGEAYQVCFFKRFMQFRIIVFIARERVMLPIAACSLRGRCSASLEAIPVNLFRRPALAINANSAYHAC